MGEAGTNIGIDPTNKSKSLQKLLRSLEQH